MNGSSKNNDAFANIGESNRSFLEAHPNATTAQQLALFEGVVEGIKTALNSTHATESKKKEDAHATVLEKMNKEINDCKAKAVADAATINDWKEKAEVGATELKKKDAAHATELVKLNKEINEWKKKAEVGATELKKKEDAHADALKDLTGQVNAKEEKVRRLKKRKQGRKGKMRHPRKLRKGTRNPG